MSVIGIVSEFNPFHNGHKYLIDAVRNDGDTVICVMSGNFTQRAEPSIFPKRTRVKVALENGVDIVLELPFLYATATAELFAKNAVRILCEFGCDTIAFGAECESEKLLVEAAEILRDSAFDLKIKEQLEKGVSYPVARQKAFEHYGVDVDISAPNNILALEYIKAVKTYYPSVKIKVVKRIGAGHDSNTVSDGVASASYIRELIKSGGDFSPFVPENAFEIYRSCKNDKIVCDYNKFDLSVMTVLRSIDSISGKTAYCDFELSSRIDNAIKCSTNLDALYNTAKTKHYTHSRVRRAVLSRLFDITRDDIMISAPYVRILGFNTACSGILGECSKKCGLPVITISSEMQTKADDKAKRIFELECKASDFYNLCTEQTGKCGSELQYRLIKAK